MSGRDAFGPNLRRIRVQRGVTLEQIADATKVSVDLWKALEQNDFSRWPTGIYARSYLRSYSAAIGVDAETTVDDFCRFFPQGDRRVVRIVREQAAIVGHSDLRWQDDLDRQPNRRAVDGRAATPPAPSLVLRVASIVAGWVGRMVVAHPDERPTRH
jgi:transcriptional regulator with XRE-family HTH domain